MSKSREKELEQLKRQILKAAHEVIETLDRIESQPRESADFCDDRERLLEGERAGAELSAQTLRFHNAQDILLRKMG